MKKLLIILLTIIIIAAVFGGFVILGSLFPYGSNEEEGKQKKCWQSGGIYDDAWCTCRGGEKYNLETGYCENADGIPGRR